MFHLTNSTDNTVKSRTGTLSSVAHHERSGSTINDPEHQRRDSVSSSATTTTNSNNANSNLAILSLSHADEKENRRLLDIQCKLKAKETGLHMVHESIRLELAFIRSSLFALAIHQREISRSLAARHDCRDRTRRNAQHDHQRIARPRSNSRGTTSRPELVGLSFVAFRSRMTTNASNSPSIKHSTPLSRHPTRST